MMMKILETKRTILRELTTNDAQFNLDLLNEPSFIKFIGDRGVRTLEQSANFIETRYQKSYRENGFGLYLVERKPETGTADPLIPIGICGFVKRDNLPFPDIGFAFLNQFEKNGYGFETAEAVLEYGKANLDLKRVLAITTQENESSVKLLEKLGFAFERLIRMTPDDEELNLFSIDLS
ncbi:MAG: GNAT family N-acetyltransferase [Pyrinomonadaceae bacterium]